MGWGPLERYRSFENRTGKVGGGGGEGGGGGCKTREEGNVSPARLRELRRRLVC